MLNRRPSSPQHKQGNESTQRKRRQGFGRTKPKNLMFSGLPPSIAAASGIAWINSVGNLGGFFGPTLVGWAKDYNGSFAGGLYALAGFALMSAVTSALWLRIPNPVRQELASVPAE
jgi:nitrate/nitrite transporter NarK